MSLIRSQLELVAFRRPEAQGTREHDRDRGSGRSAACGRARAAHRTPPTSAWSRSAASRPARAMARSAKVAGAVSTSSRIVEVKSPISAPMSGCKGGRLKEVSVTQKRADRLQAARISA